MDRRRDVLPPDAPVRPGQVLAGKYRVERMIGRGGMGFVVAARHLHLGEQVAVKLLLPGARVRPDAYERFLREGRAAARMRGEHVARVHDAGILETGQPYLVLEYLEGVDLRTLLRKHGRLPVDTAVAYLLQVCEALAEAHALGIVHRDLKPGNLFRTRRADGSDVVKVIDFGISKVMSPADGDGETPLTDHEGAIGTPAYMAPEQMRSARAADARSDIWSLGAVLYGLLAGSPPFAGETMVAVFEGILKGAPSLRAARPEVPRELEEVVHRCLRIDPAERYEDVGQLAAALAEIAPPGARLHADRAVRIMQGRASAGDPTAEERAGEEGAGLATTSGGSTPDALRDTSLASRGASFASREGTSPPTEATKDPSWERRRERRHLLLDRRTTVLSVALGVALSIAGSLAWLVRRGTPRDAPPPSSIVSSIAVPPQEASSLPPAAPVTAEGSASVAPAPPLSPRRPSEKSRRPPPPRTPATSAATATAAPRVRDLAKTPD